MALKGSSQARKLEQALKALEAVIEYDRLSAILPAWLLDDVETAIKAGRHVGTLPE